MARSVPKPAGSREAILDAPGTRVLLPHSSIFTFQVTKPSNPNQTLMVAAQSPGNPRVCAGLLLLLDSNDSCWAVSRLEPPLWALPREAERAACESSATFPREASPQPAAEVR